MTKVELDQAIEYALEGQALLFVGAGFSAGATNIQDQPIQTARGLATKLRTSMSLPEDTRLEDAAEDFASDYGVGEPALIKLLHEEFTAKDIASHHLKLAEIPWRRIYTTNYDNVLELAFSRVGKRLNPVTPGDNRRSLSKDGTDCIHLNGYIERLNHHSLWSEFKLTDTSYVADPLTGSPWDSVFRRDLETARAVFFVGYSLFDIEVKQLLFRSERVTEKTFFVIPSGTTKAYGRTAQKYGTVIPHDTAWFSDLLSKAQSEYEPLELDEAYGRAIQKFSPPSDIPPMTDQDLFDLFLLGDYRADIAWDSFHGGSKYLVSRGEAVRTMEHLKPFSIVVVCSELGNGKTLLLEQVKMLAHYEGLEVFSLVERTDDILDELQAVLKTADANTLIVVDDYPQWLEECRYLGVNISPGARVLLAARSAVHEMFSDHLSEAFGVRPNHVRNADYLFDSEANDLTKILNEYGLWGDYTLSSDKKKRHIIVNDWTQFSVMLAALMESPQIRERFDKLFGGLRHQRGFYKVVITILVLAAVPRTRSVVPSIALLENFWPDEVNNPKFDSDDAVKQLCDLRTGRIRFRSAVAATFVLQNVADATSIVGVLSAMMRVADRYARQDQIYWDLREDLARYSVVSAILPEAGRRSTLVKYYESIKNLQGCKREPNFWLQYAIASDAIKLFVRADKYFETAYKYAEGKPYVYRTNKIDNAYAGHLLEKTIDNPLIEEFMQPFRRAKNILIDQMRGEERHLRYPYRRAERIRGFYDAFDSRFSDEERQEVARAARAIAERINSLPDSVQQQDAVTHCSKGMEYIIDRVGASRTTT